MAFLRRIPKAVPCAICKEPYPRMLRIADVIFCKSCLVRAFLDLGWITDEQAEIIIAQGLEKADQGE